MGELTFGELIKELLSRVKDDSIEVTEEEFVEYESFLVPRERIHPLKLNGYELKIRH